MIFIIAVLSSLIMLLSFSNCFPYSGSIILNVKNNTITDDTSVKTSYIVQKKAASYTSVGFGPATMRRFGNQNLAYNVYGGKYWQLHEYTGLGLIGEFTSDLKSSHFAGINITSAFFPLKTEISPYICTDAGLALARGENKNAFGFSLGGSLGVLFFRSSTVQLNMQLKGVILLDKLPHGYPGSIKIRLGLLF